MAFTFICFITNFFISLILPDIDYGSQLWSFTYENHINSIRCLFNRAARLICFANYTDDINDVLVKLKWTSLDKRMKYNSMIYIYKNINIENDLFLDNITITRKSSRLNTPTPELPFCKYKFCQKNVFYNGIKICNKLPQTIIRSPDLQEFKRLVKKVL